MIYFTADTEFGSERTLELSRRPFCNIEHMDWSIINEWNRFTKPTDIIYHLGDVGNIEVLEKLNYGKMYLVPGNKETPEFLEQFEDNSKHIVMCVGDVLHVRDVPLELVHKPTDARTGHFKLFGHIHERQMVKNNALNVGMDCHHFRLVSLDTVLWYKEAIEKHYDEDVFCTL